jgi:hypothetical protein
MPLPQGDVERELQALVQDILKWPAFRRAPGRADLFKYLWEHHHEKSYGQEIWETALGNGPKSYDGDHVQNVCERCQDQADGLRDYFARKTSGWVIQLPPGGPKSGYQLQCDKVNDPQSATRAFWQPHLNSPDDIPIVYIEQLFYQDWPNRFVFRYYNCNAEHPKEALEQLQERHKETYAAYKDRLNVAYPYVAWGEVEARDSITGWFARHALRKVQPFITRHSFDESHIWQSSPILFGDASGNRFIAEALRHYPKLQIRLEEDASANGRHRAQVILKNSSDDEMRGFAHCNPVRTDSGWTLNFSPEEGTALAILTRVPNPYAADASITIFNANFSRAVHYMAHVLTHEDELRAAMRLFKVRLPFPRFFQLLYEVRLRSGSHPQEALATDYRPAMPRPLAWRAYSVRNL